MSLTPPGDSSPTLRNHRLSLGAMFSFVAGVAIIWVLLFQINLWIFSELHITGFISWIFLPAAIRMLAVMVGGWTGALGLFLGALVTNAVFADIDFINSVILATLSALGPLAAVYLCTRWLSLPTDLSGLQRSQLLVFAVAGAVFNVFPHNLFFYLTDLTTDAWSGVIPMFVGDLVGTLAVLYVASFSIRLVLNRVRT